MRHSALRTGAIAVSFCLVARSGRPAANVWIEVKSPHFTAISDAGEGSAKHVLWQFEQIRAALLKVWPWAKVDSGLPFYVFAVRNEAQLRTLGPQYWEGKQFRPVGFYVTGRDKTLVALRTDIQEADEINENPYQKAYWSYVAAVLSSSFPRSLPAWYHRGLAEVWSNSLVRDREIQVGRPIRYRLSRLREHAPIPAAEFFGAARGSRWLTGESEIDLFDAQAWGFVHYLMFGEQGQNAPKLNRFSQMLMKGVEPEVALRESLSDPKPYFDALRLYASQSLFPFARLPVALELKVEGFTKRALGQAEAATWRAQFLVAMDRPVEARALSAEAAQADPASPGPSEIEAELSDRENKPEQAKAAYAKAVELGSTRGYAYYRLAQLEFAQGVDEAALKRRETLLRRSLELDRTSGNTLSYLAETLVALHKAEDALPFAKEAVEKDPASTYHRIALASVAWELGRLDDAIQVARTALAAADDDEERRRAQRFIDDASQANTARIAAKATEEWMSSVNECFAGTHDAEVCRGALAKGDGACQSGEAKACVALAFLYDNGWGAPIDKTRAAGFFGRACSLGDSQGCARAAYLEASAPGTRDKTEALGRLQQLCGEDVEEACVGWALVLVRHPGRADQAKAREILTAACARKNDEACGLLKSLPR
jgi:TPR repeat protein